MADFPHHSPPPDTTPAPCRRATAVVASLSCLSFPESGTPLPLLLAIERGPALGPHAHAAPSRSWMPTAVPSAVRRETRVVGAPGTVLLTGDRVSGAEAGTEGVVRRVATVVPARAQPPGRGAVPDAADRNPTFAHFSILCGDARNGAPSAEGLRSTLSCKIGATKANRAMTRTWTERQGHGSS
jgi:hypothetical protein